MLNWIRYCLLVIALVSTGSSLAADYTLPADIGNGAFSSCAGGGPVYTCNAITIGNGDTVTLGSDVTLTINGNLVIGKDVVLGIGGFVFNLDVDGDVNIDRDTVISANLTATGDLTVERNVSFTGDIDVGGDIDIDKDAQFYGDITAGGDITIDNDGVLNGDVTAGGTLDIGKDTVVIGDCVPTHPQCIGGGGAAVCTTTQIASNGEEFRGISGSSDSNVIAVGKDGGIYQYDGSNWSKDSFVAGEQLNDVEVVNSNLAFAVGKKGEVLEYDGANWNQLPVPDNEELFGVWAISANEVWVAGKKAALYRWDGSSWTDMSGAGQANVDNNKDLLEVWGDASSFYVVEKDGDLYRYTRPGGPWSKLTACSSSFDIEALDVWGDGSGNVYIGGKDKDAKEAAVFLYDEGSDSCSIAFSTDIEDEIEGVSGNGSIVYGVGPGGLVVDNLTAGWSVSRYGGPDLLDVWVSSSGTAYYIGEDGYVTSCVVPLDHFSISAAPVDGSTCDPSAITIIAEDIANNSLITYGGRVNISTSTSNGNWSVNTATNAINPDPDNDDDGAVGYTFDPADMGQIILDLSNTHAETLTITVSDPSLGVSSTSVAVSFSDNVFAIMEDPVQVAGRPQLMNIAMYTNDGSNCFIDTNYNYPAVTLDASINRGGVLLSANDPTINDTITGVTPIPEGPGSVPITLDFSVTPGESSFVLDTDDVGQYILTLVDNTNVHADGAISGDAGPLTVRPFGLAITNVSDTLTSNPNPGNTLSTQPVFTKAGADLTATLTAVLWAAGDDANSDGILDTGVFYDNIATPGVAPSFATTTQFSALAGGGFTPASGTVGDVNNGGVLATQFPSGIPGEATLTTLQYDEVGSFTLKADALDFLGSGVNIISDQIVVGRFIPATFSVAVTFDGALENTCSAFTYVGEPFGYAAASLPTFTVTALNEQLQPTVKYQDDFVKLDDSSIAVVATQDDTNSLVVSYSPATMTATAANDNTGTVDYVFGNDSFRYGPAAPVSFAKFANSKLAPFDGDINPQITTVDEGEFPVEVPPVTVSVAVNPASNNLRFGRLRMENVHGSELNPLVMPAYTEYWNGFSFQKNVIDTCTAIVDAHLEPDPPGFADPTVVNALPMASHIDYSHPSPGAGNTGTVDTTTKLDTAAHLWLRYDWDGDGEFDNDPVARATFGIFEGNPVQIYIQQVYE